MASLILVIVVSGVVVVFGLVVLIVILILKRQYKQPRHKSQQNRFQSSPATQFEMHTTSSPTVNQQSPSNTNAPPLKRNLPIPAESEEASEEESPEVEEKVCSFVCDLDLVSLLLILLGIYCIYFTADVKS
jgi:cytoskeletal protein RodZ